MNLEIVYRIALIQLPGIGDLYAKLLTEYFKSAQYLFNASKNELSEIPGVGDVLLSTLCSDSLKNKAIESAKHELCYAGGNQVGRGLNHYQALGVCVCV